jgi:peptidoglycan hydrolase CwlO-like protein
MKKTPNYEHNIAVCDDLIDYWQSQLRMLANQIEDTKGKIARLRAERNEYIAKLKATKERTE